MKGSRTGSRLNGGFAISTDFPGGSIAIQSSCLGVRRPLTCGPIPAEVL
jgi:hypothetical protein